MPALLTLRRAGGLAAAATLALTLSACASSSSNQNIAYIETAWWTVIFPALAVASLVVAVQLIADNIKETWS